MEKKVSWWVWPMLVLGVLLSIAGFCLGSIIVYGQISGTAGDLGNVGSLLFAISCFSLSPLIIGLGLLGISIFTLLRKGKSSSPVQSALGTINSSGSQQKVKENGEISSISNEKNPSQTKTVDGILLPDKSIKISNLLEAEFGYSFSGSDWEVFNMDPSMTYKTDVIQQYDSPNTFFEAMSQGIKLGLFKGSPNKACIFYNEKYPIGKGFKVLFTVNSKPPHTMVMCISRQTIQDFQKSDRCLGVVKEHFYIMRI